MIDMLGIAGALLLGGCCLPQTIKTIRSNRTDDISWGFLLMWSVGEILTLSYVICQSVVDKIMVFNYLLNLCLLAPIIYIKWRNTFYE